MEEKEITHESLALVKEMIPGIILRLKHNKRHGV